MNKKTICILLMLSMAIGLAACGSKEDAIPPNNEEGEQTEDFDETKENNVEVRVGSLKGATSIGLMSLMDQAKNNEAGNKYAFSMVAAPDELTASLVKGDLDIALVPANIAAVLYQKTEGAISVIDVNTLGVLYILTSDRDLALLSRNIEMQDLKGKTIYLVGKGTTPDYVLQHLLAENGLGSEDVTLEYKAEAAEVAAIMAENPESIAMLPQPFASLVYNKSGDTCVMMDMTEEWDRVHEGLSSLVTGVTIVRNEFLESNEEAVRTFLKEHDKSAVFANKDPDQTAVWVVEAGIMENEEMAAEAIPKCNVTCLMGDEMKKALSGYLEVLFEQNPESVGGQLPNDDFYYEMK